MIQERIEKIIWPVFIAVWLIAVFLFLIDSYMDDAYIGFNYVNHLINGEGLVFNLNEKIEGFTNLGWLLFMAPFSYLVPVPFVSKALALLFIFITIILTYFMLKKTVPSLPSIFRLFMITSIAVSFDFVFFSNVGMETSLLSLLFVMAIYFQSRQKYLYASIFIISSLLVRPECVLIYPTWSVLLIISRSADKKKLFQSACIFILVLLVLEAWRYFYFHNLLPNTFSAKPTTPTDFIKNFIAFSQSGNSNISKPFANHIVLMITAFGAYSITLHKRPLGLLFISILLCGYIFAIYARPDWTGMGRYFASYLPTAIIVFISGLYFIQERYLKHIKYRKIIFSAIVLSLIFSGIFDFGYRLRPASYRQYPWYVLHSKPLVGPSKWINENTPADAVIATRRIGCLGYYSHRHIFDYRFGLTDEVISGLIKQHGYRFNSPKHDAIKNRWKEVSPDYLLEDTSVIEELMADDNKGSFEIHGIKYQIFKKFPINKNVDWILCNKITS
ncbi:hypothetical protein JW835_02155 [bacterium]|nr:hypothetical protein [bacterium]